MAKVTELKKNSVSVRDASKIGKYSLHGAIVFVVIWAIQEYIVKRELEPEWHTAISAIIGMLTARFTDGNKVVVDVENPTQAKQVAQAVRREV